MFSYLKEKLFDYLTSKYLSITDTKKVLSFTREGYALIDGQSITKEDLQRLKNEALFFQKTLLYSVLINTPKKQAQNNIFQKSNDLNDLRFSKAALWTIDVQETIVKRLTQ